MVNDKFVWEKFRSGNDDALSTIYFQHVRILFQYGMKFTKNRELVLDSIQDVFVNLIQMRSNLSSTDNICFYLMRSLRRQIVKNIKKQNEYEEINNSCVDLPNIEFTIEDILINKEESAYRKKNLSQALEELSPRQREILYYRFNCNFEYSQICDLMSIKYDTARKMIFRALSALKSCLSGKSIMLFLLEGKN